MPFANFVVGNTTFASYLLPALWGSSLPVIYRHGDDVVQHSIFHRFIAECVFRRAKVHVVNCQYLKSQITLHHPFVHPVVIYNAPRSAAGVCSVAEREDPIVRNERTRVIFLGQLAQHKGVLVLLEAFRLLAGRYPLLSLDLVGDLPGMQGCKPSGISDEIDRAVKEFSGRVLHHGFVNDPTSLFAAAHVHVCPSVWQEPSPNVVLEAKQNRLPSVVFKVGGVPELVSHQVDGYVCSDPSPGALATGIEYFLLDKRRRIQAGEAAFQSVAQRFSRERLQQQWYEILHHCGSISA